jgi:hypothetical protein
MFRIYKNFVLPRIVYIPYLITKIILFIITTLFFLKTSKENKPLNPNLSIEAGIKGWESIELKELHESACEYLGQENVQKLIIRPEEDYFKQVSEHLINKKPTHYVYDPRTGSGSTLVKLWQSLRIAIAFHRHSVIPIVILTDISIRLARAQGAIVTAKTGVVVCFMTVREVSQIFPHKRIIGPSLMPFSVKTMNYLDSVSQLKPRLDQAKALFIGSLYEPRKTILEDIRYKLTRNGYIFDIKGRSLGNARVKDSEYWEQLCYADIIVTTACQLYHYVTPQGETIQRGADRFNVPQLVYRYLEVLASGALLVAPIVPNVSRYFTPWVHFIPYDSTDDAVKVISYFLDHDSERLIIAKRGKDRAQALISARCFWAMIDTNLQADAMI